MKPQEQLENAVGSQLPAKVKEIELQPVDAPTGAPEVAAIPNAFTTAFTGLFNGVLTVKASDGRITANSRVLVAISEYRDSPSDRFIGAARMAVYNIAPYDGGFRAWCDVSWSYPLHVRFDVFVDP